VLLALYFFLAGIAVTQHPFLWIVPLSSGLFAAAAAAVAAVGSVLLPAYASWGERQKASWRSNVIHALFSALIGGGAAAYIAHDPTEVKRLPIWPVPLFVLSCLCLLAIIFLSVFGVDASRTCIFIRTDIYSTYCMYFVFSDVPVPICRFRNFFSTASVNR
jgi:hypothetical protein